MKRINILAVTLILLFITPALHAGKTRFFLAIGGGTSIKKDTASYGWEARSEIVNLDEGGAISTSYSSVINIKAGLEFSLTNSLSLTLAATYMAPSPKIDSSYILNGEWNDGDKFTTNLRRWKSDTKNSFHKIPIALSLNYNTPISPSMSISVKAGVTCMIIKSDLRSAIGFADAIETDTEYLVDWFVLPLRINKSSVALGGHIGFELEKRLSLKTALFVGLEYHLVQKKSYRWEIMPFDQIAGEERQLVLERAPDIHSGTPIKHEINPSYAGFYMGLKISL